jgi:tRNA(Arg) A34 adenosine deaminase TadA
MEPTEQLAFAPNSTMHGETLKKTGGKHANTMTNSSTFAPNIERYRMLSRNERRFLSLVSRVSVGSQHPRWKVAAVLVRSGTPVSTAVNRARNSPAQVPVADVGYHAEHRAMRAAPGRCRGATMFVGRVRRDGAPGLAKPCPTCVQAMAAAGISTVIWTTETGYDTARISTLM